MISYDILIIKTFIINIISIFQNMFCCFRALFGSLNSSLFEKIKFYSVL